MQRGKAGNGTKVQLPITPLLDVTFQLLVFFIINKETIQVEADSKLRVRSLAKVLDVCRQAGFRNVGVRQP